MNLMTVFFLQAPAAGPDGSMMWILKLLPTLKSILTRIPFLPLLLMQTVVRLLNKQM